MGRTRKKQPDKSFAVALGETFGAGQSPSRRRKGSVNSPKFIQFVPYALVAFLVFSMLSALLASWSGRLALLLFALLVLGALAAIIALIVTASQRKAEQVRALQLSDIDSMTDGHSFERYIAKLMAARGYKAEVTKGSGDLGVDVIAHGPNVRYAIQCKISSKQAISRRGISDVVAALTHYRCTHAMVITNNYFTPDAKKLAESTGCVLVDRDHLASWIHEWHGNSTSQIGRSDA
jgi:HJR/Mrr/RecB family endonuclease